jgi:hypothetical protein
VYVPGVSNTVDYRSELKLAEHDVNPESRPVRWIALSQGQGSAIRGLSSVRAHSAGEGILRRCGKPGTNITACA